ncbi:MAG: sigma-70 family RNA polymerase sigma factor, partial [Alphaproteobacteria bacterium]
SLSARQRLARLKSALKELPERTRVAFAFHKFDGMSHAETARRLGISVSAVEKHISAALKHLLRRLPDDE